MNKLHKLMQMYEAVDEPIDQTFYSKIEVEGDYLVFYVIDSLDDEIVHEKISQQDLMLAFLIKFMGA